MITLVPSRHPLPPQKTRSPHKQKNGIHGNIRNHTLFALLFFVLSKLPSECAKGCQHLRWVIVITPLAEYRRQALSANALALKGSVSPKTRPIYFTRTALFPRRRTSPPSLGESSVFSLIPSFLVTAFSFSPLSGA